MIRRARENTSPEDGPWLNAMADWMEQAHALLVRVRNGPVPHATRFDIDVFLDKGEVPRGG